MAEKFVYNVAKSRATKREVSSYDRWRNAAR